MRPLILFMPRFAFERLSPGEGDAAISIGDPGQPAPANLAQFRLALRLTFLDIVRQDIAGGSFSTSQAEDLVGFLRGLDGIKRIQIHCEAGVSRSAAVALVAEAVSGGQFPERHRADFANTLVLAQVKQVTGLDISRPSPAEIEEAEDFLIYTAGRLK